jgi:hypothetical protein
LLPGWQGFTAAGDAKSQGLLSPLNPKILAVEIANPLGFKDRQIGGRGQAQGNQGKRMAWSAMTPKSSERRLDE